MFFSSYHTFFSSVASAGVEDRRIMAWRPRGSPLHFASYNDLKCSGDPRGRQALWFCHSLHNEDNGERSNAIVDQVEEDPGPEGVGAPAQKGEGQSNDKKDGE